MNIQTTFKNKGANINDNIKEYAEEKMHGLIKFLGKHAHEDVRFDIEFSDDPKNINGEVCRVDIVVIAGGLDKHAVGHGESMQAAIDMARDDLARRLRRAKTKDLNLFRKGKRMIKKMLRMGA